LDLSSQGLGDFSLGDFSLGDFSLGDFSLTILIFASPMGLQGAWSNRVEAPRQPGGQFE
jgi:hypothetical protein